MCELFAMSARFPTTIHLSLDELARHGGATGPHRDGWGLAFVQGHDALVVREPEAASESPLIAFMQHQDLRSSQVLAHLRKATQGPRSLCNTQPFVRELGGRAHLFVHNGMLTGIETDARFPTQRFRTIGETDSEHAFCALLEKLGPLWEHRAPTVEERLSVVEAFAADLRTLGPANFLYCDTDALFAHGDRRRSNTGEIQPPGLHWLCRRCSPGADGVPIAGVSIAHGEEQEIALIASVPLSGEAWVPFREGEIVILREGRVTHHPHPDAPTPIPLR